MSLNDFSGTSNKGGAKGGGTGNGGNTNGGPVGPGGPGGGNPIPPGGIAIIAGGNLGGMQPQKQSDPTGLLINYNQKALEPAMFRDRIVEQTMGVLINKNKPNPLLVGPAGVGKTKIVEEIARLLVMKDPRVPDMLENSVIYELPLSNIIAGSSLVGAMEEKIQAVVEFCEDPANNAVLFIDEIHQLMSNDHTYGTIAQIMKPALARGAIRCIGATTTQEAKTLMNDPALNRRFTRVIVDEFTADQTVELLKTCKLGFFQHYKNKIMLDDTIFPTVVRLADEYRPVGSHRPDNAITLLDCTIGEALVQRKVQIQAATIAGDQIILNAFQANPLVPITEKQLRATAGRIMTGGIEQKPLDVQELTLSLTPVKGQDEPLKSVVLNMRRNELKLFSRNKPLSMLFAGSSGVGKTEVAKIIARYLTGGKPLIMNMTEYHSSASINRIIGAPAGYAGSDSNMELPFDCLQSNPMQVIVLDEFEKADPAVQKLFMSVLEEGELKTNRGDSVDFSRAIIIATTNAGHTGIGPKAGLGFGNKPATAAAPKKETVETLAKWFDRALLNRFTDIITFNAISRDVYKDILADKYAREAARILSEKPNLANKLLPVMPDDKLEETAEATYVADFGARPAMQAVITYVEEQVL